MGGVEGCHLEHLPHREHETIEEGGKVRKRRYGGKGGGLRGGLGCEVGWK
jgi:hypothetical protein